MLSGLPDASLSTKSLARSTMFTGVLNVSVSSATCECWLELSSFTATVNCGAQSFGPPMLFSGCPANAVLFGLPRKNMPLLGVPVTTLPSQSAPLLPVFWAMRPT